MNILKKFFNKLKKKEIKKDTDISILYIPRLLMTPYNTSFISHNRNTNVISHKHNTKVTGNKDINDTAYFHTSTPYDNSSSDISSTNSIDFGGGTSGGGGACGEW